MYWILSFTAVYLTMMTSASEKNVKTVNWLFDRLCFVGSDGSDGWLSVLTEIVQ